ncbi:hypothetical protein B0H17DRAFT_1145034 [Mycena rosella]|uniref:Uncharacterized protein n=1 Tax=Mycena rosella TaxID=1033263 RepID=A0AAD7CS82_MYCRO|nr:hypothetical protein B0H17DRAFT_1145034 [Mycena rosella]
MAPGSFCSLHAFIIDVPIALDPSHSSPVAPTVTRQWGCHRGFERARYVHRANGRGLVLPGAPVFMRAYKRLAGARGCNAAVCDARQACTAPACGEPRLRQPRRLAAVGRKPLPVLNALDMWLCVPTVHAAVNNLLHAVFLNELLPKSDGADISYLVFCIIFPAPVMDNFFMIYDPYFVVVVADDVQSSLMAVPQMRIFVLIVRRDDGGANQGSDGCRLG